MCSSDLFGAINYHFQATGDDKDFKQIEIQNHRPALINQVFAHPLRARIQREVLQMSVLQPEIAILDEIDSGLDIDAMRIVAEGVNRLVRETGMGVLMITHYQRLLNEIHPDYVHIMMDGGMIRSGDAKLALEIEERGYDWVRE